MSGNAEDLMSSRSHGTNVQKMVQPKYPVNNSFYSHGHQRFHNIPDFHEVWPVFSVFVKNGAFTRLQPCTSAVNTFLSPSFHQFWYPGLFNFVLINAIVLDYFAHTRSHMHIDRQENKTFLMISPAGRVKIDESCYQWMWCTVYRATVLVSCESLV